jgi:hypothetical protein
MKLKFEPSGDPQRDADGVAKQIITSNPAGPAEAVYDLITAYHKDGLGGSKLLAARSLLLGLIKQNGSRDQKLWLTTCFTLVLNWLYYRKGNKQ